jgi:hypothetical protein
LLRKSFLVYTLLFEFWFLHFSFLFIEFLTFLEAASLVASGNLVEAANRAREGANSTASMKTASAGRSNYLNAETLEGTPDPGAVAVAIVLEALAK